MWSIIGEQCADSHLIRLQSGEQGYGPTVQSPTPPRGHAAPLSAPGFTVHPHPSVHVLISYPVSRPTSYPRITAHTYLLRVVIIPRMEKVPT